MRRGREGSGPAPHIAVSASRPFAEEVRSMSESATNKRSVTVDCELLVRTIVELDGIATYEMLRSGSDQTRLAEMIYAVLEPLEREVFGPMTDEQAQAQHDRGVAGGREMFRAMVNDVLPDA